MTPAPSAPAPSAPSPEGIHYLIELRGGAPTIMRDATALEHTLIHCAQQAGATVVESFMHHFNPHGLSGIVVIAESHLAVHTWPEHDYASIDIYTCGEADLADQIYHLLIKALTPTHHTSQRLTRIPPPQ